MSILRTRGLSHRKSSFLLIGFILGAIPAAAQAVQTVERSPEACALIQRVLHASAGDNSPEAIRDIVATGTFSAATNSEDTSENAVTVYLRGVDQLRVDSTQPTGVRSLFYNRGGLSSREGNGGTLALGVEDPVIGTSHFFPLAQLTVALHDSSYSLTAPELITDEENGHNLYHFRLQRVGFEHIGPSRRTLPSVVLDYYVDASTNWIVRVQNLHRDRGRMTSDRGRGPYEICRFSEYRLDSGLLLPHQLSILLDKRLISTINISEYKLNTGLTEDNFTPVPKQ